MFLDEAFYIGIHPERFICFFFLVNLFGMQALGMLVVWSVIFLVCVFMSGSDRMFKFVSAAFSQRRL